MAKPKIALNLREMSVNDEVAFGQKISEGIRASTLTDKAALSDEIEAVYQNLAAAESEAKLKASIARSATENRDAVRLIYANSMQSVASAVEQATANNGPQMEAIGYELVSTNRTSANMTKVLGLQLSPGDFPGQLHAQWEPMRGARLYRIEWRIASTNSAPAGEWKAASPSSSSKCDVESLPSNVPVEIRVSAQGADNVAGPWSDAATLAPQ